MFFVEKIELLAIHSTKKRRKNFPPLSNDIVCSVLSKII